MRYIILILLLTLIPAHADDLIAQGDGFEFWLPSDPIAEIPQEWHGRMRDAQAYEDQVAMLIAMGHVWHKQIRDSQQKLTWFVGRIYPDIDIPGDPTRAELDRLLRYEVPGNYIDDALDRYGKPFNWPSGQELLLVFKDGRRLSADLIIASEGVILNINPYKPRETVYIYPLERPLRFTDFMRILPSRDHFALPVWCAFPRRPRIDGKPWRWSPEDVVAIELTGGIGDEKASLSSDVGSVSGNAVRAAD